MKIQIITWVGILSVACVVNAADAILFHEDFESGDLDQWAAGHHGVVVLDPLQAANHVLTFTSLNAGGDIFTAASLPVGESNKQYFVSFDYLGIFTNGSSPFAGLGGFFGIFVSGTEPHYWIAGTDVIGLNTSLGIQLMDDDMWHHYEINITPLIRENHLTQVHLMLEDWISSGGVAGDAYFDNIQLVARRRALDLEDIVPCAGPLGGGTWKNHGEYVSAVARATSELVWQGAITTRERTQFIRQAANSSCGTKPNREWRTRRPGR
jgi:hypothetical protein